MKTSKVYISVLSTVFGAGLALTAYAGCGACGGDAGHTHGKEAVTATCSSEKADCSTEKSEKWADKKSAECSTAKKAECSSGKKAESTAQSCAADHKGHAVKTLSTDELKAVVESEKAVVVLDARSGKYDDGRRIPGAKTLSEKSTPEEVAKVVGDKDTEVVTYCSNLQCPASARLAAHLKKLGYTHVTEYPEGIAGWVEAGNTVEQEKK